MKKSMCDKCKKIIETEEVENGINGDYTLYVDFHTLGYTRLDFCRDCKNKLNIIINSFLNK